MNKDHLHVQRHERPTPPWKRRLEAQIKATRREVSQLSEANRGNMKKQVPRRYSRMPIPEALEAAKQRLQALASRLKKYNRENEARRESRLVSTQPAEVYGQWQGHYPRADPLRLDSEQQRDCTQQWQGHYPRADPLRLASEQQRDCTQPPNSQDSDWTRAWESEIAYRGAYADHQMEPGCSTGGQSQCYRSYP